jgi:hypothetical protein
MWGKLCCLKTIFPGTIVSETVVTSESSNKNHNDLIFMWHNGYFISIKFYIENIFEVSEWLLFNVNSAILFYHDENKSIFNEMMLMRSTLY